MTPWLAMALLAQLDAATLLRVEINPEARVKVVRGSARPRLVGPTRFLVRVDNAAGATARLQLRCPERDDGSGERDRWLRLSLTDLDGSPAVLAGPSRQWLALDLATDRVGPHEATFAFDIGQGTQDLGFRASVAVLFWAVRR